MIKAKQGGWRGRKNSQESKGWTLAITILGGVSVKWIDSSLDYGMDQVGSEIKYRRLPWTAWAQSST